MLDLLFISANFTSGLSVSRFHEFDYVNYLIAPPSGKLNVYTAKNYLNINSGLFQDNHTSVNEDEMIGL